MSIEKLEAKYISTGYPGSEPDEPTEVVRTTSDPDGHIIIAFL